MRNFHQFHHPFLKSKLECRCPRTKIIIKDRNLLKFKNRLSEKVMNKVLMLEYQGQRLIEILMEDYHSCQHNCKL